MNLDKLVSTFDFLDDWEERYALIIDLGRKLAPMDDGLKNDESKVRGCQSQVWMVHKVQGDTGRLEFIADSDAHIVRGLIAILMIIYSGRTPAEILEVPIKEHFGKLGLDEHLSPLRSNGLHSMVERIRLLAAAEEARP
ncbi:MAG: SufE family protein [Planctomycetota bacterium]